VRRRPLILLAVAVAGLVAAVLEGPDVVRAARVRSWAWRFHDPDPGARERARIEWLRSPDQREWNRVVDTYPDFAVSAIRDELRSSAPDASVVLVSGLANDRASPRVVRVESVIWPQGRGPQAGREIPICWANQTSLTSSECERVFDDNPGYALLVVVPLVGTSKHATYLRLPPGGCDVAMLETRLRDELGPGQ
jgi:hypothetical protein